MRHRVQINVGRVWFVVAIFFIMISIIGWRFVETIEEIEASTQAALEISIR